MALSRRQKYIIMIAIAAIAIIIAAVQLLLIVVTVQTTPTVSIARDADQMLEGYSEVKPNATQNDVIAVMGSQFAVMKCPPSADPNCAHTWHYEADGQAWDFTFDMDGNLMSKQLGTAGQ